jgi:hypothetical protein
VKVPASPPLQAARHQRQQRHQRGGMQEEQRDAQQHALQVAGLRARTAAPRAWRIAQALAPQRVRRVHALPAQVMTAAPIDSRALSRNTQALPRLAIKAPATSGPMMREAFIDTPFSASAAGSCGRGTSSGTMAANTGQRMRQADAVGEGQRQQQRRADGTEKDDGTQQQRHHRHPELREEEVALAVQDVGQRPAGQAEQEHRQRGRGLHQRHPDRRGRVSEVISQAAATSFIHMLMLAISQVIQSMRKTGSLNGASGDRSAPCAGARRGESGWGSGMAGGSGWAAVRPARDPEGHHRALRSRGRYRLADSARKSSS